MVTSTSPVYHKRLGILRDATLAAEISSLDARRDCQRIVHLLACYEFPFDIMRALELALFHTYGSVSVSGLLDRTGEFRKSGQKRYDDTRLLISHLLEDGYDSEFGTRAIARMNHIHGEGRIKNDDFLFVLSTFVSYPVNWLNKNGRRPMTPHEQLAWFSFFRTVGERMNIKGIPDTWEDFQRWVEAYEVKNLVYAASNRNVANATVAIFAGWFIWPLNRLVEPVVRALINDRLMRAFGYRSPPALLRVAVRTALHVRKHFKRVVHLERYPRLIAHTRNRTYPGNAYTIERVGPDNFK